MDPSAEVSSSMPDLGQIVALCVLPAAGVPDLFLYNYYKHLNCYKLITNILQYKNTKKYNRKKSMPKKKKRRVVFLII